MISAVHVPLTWKLAVMVGCVVIVVNLAMVPAWFYLHSTQAPAVHLDSRPASFVRLALLNAFFWTVVAAVLSTIYVRRITVPLSRISTAADEVEAGNLDVSVPVPEGDEMEAFVEKFNALIGSLRSQRAKIDRLVEDLNQANARLTGDVQRSERLAALGTLSAGLAHELNNLLGSILGYTAVMQKETGSGHALAKDLAMVRRDGLRASELLSRFLLFARPAAMKPRLGSIEDIVESCLQVLALPIQRQSIRLAKSLDPGLPVIVCDTVMIEQALFNVLHNAVQAMKHGGELRVLARKTRGDRLEIVVEDTGPGIPRENLSRVFDPFFTTKGPAEGTGLGLSIAHRVMEQHGGSIRIFSSGGEGTRVAMELPLKSRPRDEAIE